MQAHPDFPNLYVIDHPLVQHKLTLMRSVDCETQIFRDLLKEIAMLMGYEMTRDLPTEEIDITTPLTDMKAPVLAGNKLAIVPILRAGLGMSDGLFDLVPFARIGHIGLYRDPETKEPVEYLVKLPTTENRRFLVVDPMLATGHSAAYAIDVLLKHGAAIEDISFMALVTAPEGVRAFHAKHPDVKLYVASLDDHLNENAYIVPGLGDAGDRLFGTL